jgi:hypothetical protein
MMRALTLLVAIQAAACASSSRAQPAQLDSQRMAVRRLSGLQRALDSAQGAVRRVDTQRTMEEPRDSLRIRSAVPSIAHRGDTVAFELTDPIPAGTGIVRVSIGGFAARLVGARFTEIVAVIPRELPSNDSLPDVFAYVGGIHSASFRGLRIVRSRPDFWDWKVVWAAATGTAITGLILAALFPAVRDRIARPPRMRLAPAPAFGQTPGFYGRTVEISAPPGATEPLPAPTAPETLIDAIVNGECCLFAGAGLSAQDGYPTWLPFVTDLLDWATAAGHINGYLGRSLEAALQQGATTPVVDTIMSAVPSDALTGYLSRVFAPHSRRPPAVHQSLKRIAFCAALTTNFDNLLERTFSDGDVPVLTPDAADALRTALLKERFFILKLFGTLERPETIMVAPLQFRDAVSRNRSFSGFMDTMFLSRTFLFLGASLDGIQTYLDGLGIKPENLSSRPPASEAPVPRTHYALVAVTDDAWRAQAEVLQRRYNIQVLPYTPDDQFTPLREFVSSLADAAGRAGATVTGPTASTAASRESAGLKNLRLENIGPFESLELKLDRNWNVILGDNGVGKSTILKAIGLGLCGRDGRRYAGRLVRTGQSYGKVILSTERNTYVTQIFQQDGDAEIEAPGRAFEAEGWLALGFSPLRTVTWERPKGPTAAGKSRPTSADVLPLVSGEVDPRMNSVKQWLVNLDYYAKGDASHGRKDGRYARLQQDFSATIKTLLQPMQLDIQVTDATNGLVQARTPEGWIPIESVSQGTASLLGWIGVLVQRLYEVFDEDLTPRDRYALVMLDEIDAHMHPAWQRSLVSRLRTLFPNVQFIATTHSPLIVGGMTANQLVRFARNADGKVVRIELAEGSAMGRSDQVLRSPLFDLPLTLDVATEQLMADYQAALADPSPEARKRQADLEKQLTGRIPRSSTEPAERYARELVEAVINSQLFPDSKVSALISEQAKRLLDAAARVTTGP